MGRVSVLITLAIALVTAFGCGGGLPDAIKNAPPPKAIDLGLADDYPLGVTPREPGFFIVKAEVEGEVRMFIMENKVPGPKVQPIIWDGETGMFYDESKNYRYDIEGKALHKVRAEGLKKGEPGVPMFRFKIYLDKKTGNIQFEPFVKIKMENREDKSKNAYIVVP